MGLINTSIDVHRLEAWALELSEKGMRNAIRRAVDQSARFARKVTIDVIAKDIGVSKSKIAAAVPKVVTTKAGDLSARWTISKLRISIADVSGASISKGSGLRASTHRLTGGGSAALDVSKAFLVTMANGARFVAYRKSKSRLPIKGIYAETPATAMGQQDGAARKMWEKTANQELSRRLAIELEKQFAKENLSASAPDIAD